MQDFSAYEGRKVKGPDGGTYTIRNGVPVREVAPAPVPVAAGGGLKLVVPKTADPFHAQEQAFKVEDQEFQRRGEARAAEDQQFQREKFEFEKTKAVTDPKLVEAERTAAFLATRIAGGMADLNAATKEEPSADKPGIAGTVAGFFGKEARNFANSPARRQVEAAQTDILDAALTLGTGAAYTKEQLEGYREAYFPKLTDDAETIASKRARLARLLEAAKVKAGNAAPQIDQALAALNGGEDNSLEAFQSSMNQIILDTSKAPEQRLQEALALAQRSRRGVDPEQIKAAIASGRPKVVEDPEFVPPESGGFWSDFGQATGNTLTGLAQGVAAIPDALTNATGAVLSLPARAVGADWAADALMNPVTIGGVLERANPTPQDGVGRGVRLASQIAGGIGSLPPRATTALVNRVTGGAPPPMMPPNAFRPQTMQAADELAASTGTPIQPLAADVGGATTRRLTAMGAQLPFSAAPIVRGGQRLTGQTQRARDVIASRAGNVAEPEQTGETVKAGLTTFRTRTSQQARNMYQAAEEAAGDVTIQPKTVLTRLGEHIRQEAQVPGGTDALPILEKLATSLSTEGSFSISGVRGMRSALMARLETAGMTPTNAQRIVNDLVQAAGDDINLSLTAAGKSEAAKAYRSADKFWAERMEVVNNAIKPIIGRNGEKSGEEVLQGIQRAAKGNTARLSQIMRALPEDDAATVRGTLIGQLGKSSAGTQNAEGSAFSLSQFLTHWNQMTPRARSILFDRGLHDDLNRLATVADGSKQAARYANSSNTGGVIGGLGTGATLGVDWITFGATALAQYGGGRLLAAPGFARWLARAPRNPAALPSHVKQLSKVAARNPAMADEIFAFGENILGAANSNVPSVASAAASDGTEPQPY